MNLSRWILGLMVVWSAVSFADNVGALNGSVQIEQVTSVRLVDGGQIQNGKVDRSAVIEVQGTYFGYPGTLVGRLEKPGPDHLYGANQIASELKLYQVSTQAALLTFGPQGKPTPMTPHLPFTVRIGLEVSSFFGSGTTEFNHAPQVAESWVVFVTAQERRFSGVDRSTIEKDYGFTATVNFVGNEQWHEAKGWTIKPFGPAQN